MKGHLCLSLYSVFDHVCFIWGLAPPIHCKMNATSFQRNMLQWWYPEGRGLLSPQQPDNNLLLDFRATRVLCSTHHTAREIVWVVWGSPCTFPEINNGVERHTCQGGDASGSDWLWPPLNWRWALLSSPDSCYMLEGGGMKVGKTQWATLCQCTYKDPGAKYGRECLPHT